MIPRPEGPSLVLPEKDRGLGRSARLLERDTCKVARGVEDLGTGCGGAGGGTKSSPGFPSLTPRPSLLFPQK